jgi:integrase/recombinase XerD
MRLCGILSATLMSLDIRGNCRFPANSISIGATGMLFTSEWRVDVTKILTRQEIGVVLADLHRKARRSLNTRMNLTIFRLACCCGLRVSEIAGLRLSDVHVAVARPHLVIRPTVAKYGRGRKVPLWWDEGTLNDITEWIRNRKAQTASGKDPLVCSLQPSRFGSSLGRHVLRKRFRTACRSLGKERLSYLTIHHGRHTFISHAIIGGRTLPEVRDAAGHSNISITSCYLHASLGECSQASLFGD